MFKITTNLIIIIQLLIPSFVFAADNGTPNWTMPDLQIDIGELKNGFKAPTECGTDKNGNQLYCFNWIGDYIVGVYKYAIGIAGILATIVMMIGGFIWLMAGGNQSRISEAKAWIGASLTGLIIALSSYLILYQVNPNLVKFDALKVAWIKPIVEKKEVTKFTALSDTDARKLLSDNKITVNKSNCTTKDPSSGNPCCNCTSLEGIPHTAINGLIKLKENCLGCNLMVTGGTEHGHKTHGMGKAIVDLGSDTNLNNYIINNKADTQDKGSYKNTSGQTIYIRSYFNGKDKKWYDMEYTKNGSTETIHHWHISF